MDDGWVEYDIQPSNQTTENQLPIRNLEIGDPLMIPQQTILQLTTLRIVIEHLKVCEQSLWDASLREEVKNLGKQIINLEQKYEDILPYKEQS